MAPLVSDLRDPGTMGLDLDPRRVKGLPFLCASCTNSSVPFEFQGLPVLTQENNVVGCEALL